MYPQFRRQPVQGDRLWFPFVPPLLRFSSLSGQGAGFDHQASPLSAPLLPGERRTTLTPSPQTARELMRIGHRRPLSPCGTPRTDTRCGPHGRRLGTQHRAEREALSWALRVTSVGLHHCPTGGQLLGGRGGDPITLTALAPVDHGAQGGGPRPASAMEMPLSVSLFTLQACHL